MAVSTINSTGGDYASLSLWEAGVQGDLTASETQEAECEAFEDTTAVTIDGSTTDATHYLRIYAASGAEAQMPWSTSAYRLAATAGGALLIQDAFVRVERIQIDVADTGSNRVGCHFSTGGDSGRAVGVLVRESTTNTNTGFRNDADGVSFVNCVAYSPSNTVNSRGFFANPATGSFVTRLYNCTMAGWGIGYDRLNGAVHVKNSAAYNNTTDFNGTFNAASTNNASEDGTAPNTNEVTITTDPFVDSANHDYHIAASSELEDAGTDLSADAGFAFSTDFDGATRSGTWDIGADEITAASPTAAITGTAGDGCVEADIVAGGQTIIITLTGDTWVASGATFDAQRQAIIDGLDSAQSEATGWNAEVRDKAAVTEVVRTSDTVVTITLAAQAAYAITANETITVTVPGAALTGAAPITAAPTFQVTQDSSVSIAAIAKYYAQMRSQ